MTSVFRYRRKCQVVGFRSACRQDDISGLAPMPCARMRVLAHLISDCLSTGVRSRRVIEEFGIVRQHCLNNSGSMGVAAASRGTERFFSTCSFWSRQLSFSFFSSRISSCISSRVSSRISSFMLFCHSCYFAFSTPVERFWNRAEMNSFE